MNTKRTETKSTLKMLQNRSLDGRHFDNPGHRFFKETISCSQSLYKRDLFGHFGCVNAIEFSSNGELIASGGDDRRLLLWNVWKTVFDGKEPSVIKTEHFSNINSCSFDCSGETVATGGSDGLLLIHDIKTLKTSTVYDVNDTIFCVSPDPINATNIALAGDCGKVHILDTRLPLDSGLSLVGDLGASMHSVAFNPSEPRLLATANSKHGITLWDVRKPRHVFIKSGVQNCMSVSFNSRGDQLLVLRRRNCPALYDMKTMLPICKFDYKSYYNACTLKSASFAGLQDEYVMSGSDDFCVYLWEIPGDKESYCHNLEPHMILKGHRSIVNQVRYCPFNQMIISSGVEKLIKMWTPYALPGSTGHLKHSRRYGDDVEPERNAYSHEQYIHMVLEANSFLVHDYRNGNTEEEPCMIAFFDSLIQREVEQSADESDFSSTDTDDLIEGQQGESVPFPLAVGPGGRNDEREPRSDSHGGRGRPPSRRPRETDGTDPEERPQGPSDINGSLPQNVLDDSSSSDSAGEVDEILSAMYNRYMRSRDQAADGYGQSGKKISSVIAQRKRRDRSKRGLFDRGSPPPSHVGRKRETKNAGSNRRGESRTMSVLADVIDNFVDTLVGTSDDGSSGSNANLGDENYDDTPSAHRRNVSGLGFLTDSETIDMPGSSNTQTDVRPSVSQPQSEATYQFRYTVEDGLRDMDLFFGPELKAFSCQFPTSSSESDTYATYGGDVPQRKSMKSKTVRPKSKTNSSSESLDTESDSERSITTVSTSSSFSASKKQRNGDQATKNGCCPPHFPPDASSDESRIKLNGQTLNLDEKSKGLCETSKVSDSVSSPSFLSSLPSSSSHSCHSRSATNCISKSSHPYSNICTNGCVAIVEKKGVFHDDEYKAGDSHEAKSVTFKKIHQSKGRRFRKKRKHESHSSSSCEDD